VNAFRYLPLLYETNITKIKIIDYPKPEKIGPTLAIAVIIQYLNARGLVCRAKFCTAEQGVVYPTRS
jgi:hypothetical protein